MTGRRLLPLLVTVLVTACASPPRVPPHAGDAPSYEALAAAQARRLEHLQRLRASGSIELRWVDDDGARHFENGDLDLWIGLPRRTALRVSKLTSEDLFWLGSDEQRYWLFDLLNEPTTLLVADHGTDLAAFGAPTALSLRPLVLLDLLGLTPLPPAPAEVPVTWDERLERWTVTTEGIGGRVRIGVDAATLLPRAVEALGADGEVVAAAALDEYALTSVPGTAPLDRPAVPERVEVVEAGGQGTATLFLREHSGDVDQDRLTRLVNLDVLVTALRPERVEER